MSKLSDVSLIEVNEQYNKVLFWFFSYPDSRICLNELCKRVKISKNNANRIINRLEKEGFLFKEVIGKSWLITCNKKNILNRTAKIAFNMNMVFKSGILDEINKKFPNFESIILFGSYRKGDDTDKSDIDIAVRLIGNNELKIEELGIIKNFGYRKNVKVNLNIFSKDKVSKNIFSNIVNGIVLDGFLEVEK